MLRFVLLTFLACSYATPTTPADPEATAQQIRALPEPFRTDLALRWADRGGPLASQLLEELFEQRAYSNLPPFPRVAFTRDGSSTPNQLTIGYGARVDRLSLGSRAVAWMQSRSARQARLMVDRLTEELETLRWAPPDCQDHLLPVWSAYYSVLPSTLAHGFTPSERAKGDDLELARRAMRLIRSISQLHDALAILDQPSLSGNLRTAMMEELSLRLNGWPVSGREWWVLYKPLIQRASKFPELALSFRSLTERALVSPVCGMPSQAPPPHLDALGIFHSSFAPLNLKPLEWSGKAEWQPSAPVESPLNDDDYQYFLDGVRRLRSQTLDRQNEPQWRQAYRDLIRELNGWRRGKISPVAFLSGKLSALSAIVAMPASGQPPKWNDIQNQKTLPQSEEVSSGAPVAEFFTALTSQDGLEVQAKHPGYWLIRLTLFMEQVRTLAPGVQQRYADAIARQTNPIIQAYAKAAAEGWL